MVPTVVKFIETGSRMVVVRGWGEKGVGELLIRVQNFFFFPFFVISIFITI